MGENLAALRQAIGQKRWRITPLQLFGYNDDEVREGMGSWDGLLFNLEEAALPYGKPPEALA